MEWRICKAFPEYAVNEDGAVKRIAPRRPKGGGIGKIMKPYRREDGYNMYILREGNKSYHKKAHQLVIEAFVGPKPSLKHEVRHKDGTRYNDNYLNLEWGTNKENKADMIRHGTRPYGEKSPYAKITENDVREIKKLYKEKFKQREIGRYFGIGQVQVSRILRGIRWAHMHNV